MMFGQKAFEAWGMIVIRRRWLVLCGALCAALLLALQVPGLRFDSSPDSFLPKGDRTLEVYESFRDAFGEDQMVLVAASGPSVFDAGFLRRLHALHHDLEQSVPHLTKMTSLVNARDTRGEGDTLLIEELMPEPPVDEAAIRRLEARVFDNPLYVDALVNRAGTMATLLLEPDVYSGALPADAANDPLDGTQKSALLSDEERSEQVSAIRGVLERHLAPDFELSLTGPGVVAPHANSIVRRDAGLSIMASLLLNALVLGFLFRRVGGIGLPLITVLLTVISTFGVMAWTGIPMSVTSSVLPRFLVVVGLCNSIQLLKSVYQGIGSGRPMSQALPAALGETGVPIVLASLTTAGGILGFTGSDLAQTVNLGISSFLGVMLAMLFSLLFLPACLAILPTSARAAGRSNRLEVSIGNLMGAVARLSTQRPRRVLGVALVALVVACIGLRDLQLKQLPLEWLPERDPVRAATERLDRELAGVQSLAVLVHTDQPRGLLDPAVLQRLDASAKEIEKIEIDGASIGKVTSLVDIVKETHRALNADDPAHYVIPDQRELVTQELLLFEVGAGDDMAKVVDRDYTTARLNVRHPYADSMLYLPFVASIRDAVEGSMGEGVRVEVTGLTQVIARTTELLYSSMIKSYAFSLLSIVPLLILMLRSVRLGLLAMIPNFIPLVFVLGVIGWLGIPLDSSTLLLGCLVLGLAVDDTIHFMYRLQVERERCASIGEAVERAMRSVGAALAFTTLVLSVGFLSSLFAYMQNVSQFGMLAAVSMLIVFGAIVFLSPALVALFGGQVSLPVREDARAPEAA